MRTADVARQYADVITARLGNKRVKIIAEAFRPTASRQFRAATPEEIPEQLDAYKGYPVYLVARPHYVPAETVEALMH